jgi:dimeric dUTPase (all-alpha-NTP-PPase superfamily)
MLKLQASMNAKVNPQWLEAGYPFLLAAAIEGAEAIEHRGWKWWKKQEANIPQIQMELVDIFHFALSAELVRNGGDLEQTASLMFGEYLSSKDDMNVTINFDGASYKLNEIDALRRLELMIGMSISRRFSISLFSFILADWWMSWNELYRQYVCKNVLNFFRQDNGYKDGSYEKMWGGREDNEHLVEIMNEEDPTAPDFPERIYAALEERYRADLLHRQATA